MGCFNMRCAATGVPIVHNTPVVMFDLCGAYPHHVQQGLRLDKFGDQMAVMSMPRFGLYNDYGDIESEEDRGWEWINSRLYLEAQQMTYVPKFEDGQYQNAKRQADDYEQDHRMFILRGAYEFMVEHDNSDDTWYGDDFDTWGERREASQAEFLSILAQEDERSQELLAAGSEKVLVTAINRIRLDDVVRTAFSLGQEDQRIWLDLMTENPEVGMLYYKYIGKMRRSTHTAEWSLRPSMYSGQTVEEEILVMRQIGTRYLEGYFKETEQW